MKVDSAVEKADKMLQAAGYSAYLLTLNHLNKKAFEWFKDAQIGDMVFEASTAYRNRSWPAVGKLVKKELEPFPGDWADEAAPLETAWYIEALDGRTVRWTNCEFLRLPVTPNMWDL